MKVLVDLGFHGGASETSVHNHNDEASSTTAANSHGDDSVETEKTLTQIGMAPECIGSDYFITKVYHGGFLQGGLYVGGRHDFYNKCDKNMMSFVELKNMVNQLEFFNETQSCEFWYKDGVEDGELIRLQNDEDVVQMCSSVPIWRLLIVYCDQKIAQEEACVAEHENDALLDAHIDYMNQLQSYGVASFDSEDERNDEEDENMTYDPASIDDEYYQYGRDDDDDDEHTVQSHTLVQGSTTHTQTQFVQDTSTSSQPNLDVAATRLKDVQSSKQASRTSFNNVEELKIYKRKSFSKNIV